MPPIIFYTWDDWLIYEAARKANCKAVVVRDGRELQSDQETWTIGEQEFKNLPEWQDGRNSKPIV